MTRPAALTLLALLGFGSGVARGQSWSEVDQVLEDAIRDHLFPGAVLLAGRADTVLYARGYGRLTWSSAAPKPSPDSTLWDLASLTKLLASVSTIMVYRDRGLLDLDAPVARYVPQFTGGGREAITVRMLLDHTSGLRPWAPLWRTARSKREVLALLVRERPERPSGASARYSDLNGMLLGLVVERVGAASLDRLAAREVFRPLGMAEARFRVPGPLRPRTAPTSMARRKPVAGIVDDANARRMAGVAGHAGLFDTGADLARFAQAWLQRGAPGGRTWVSPDLIAEFLSRSPRAGTRALGWNTPDSTGPTMYGALSHPGMAGHSGWTGTSLWIDPEHDLFLVLLANRTLGTARESLDRMLLVRAGVSDAVHRALPGPCRTAGGGGAGC